MVTAADKVNRTQAKPNGGNTEMAPRSSQSETDAADAAQAVNSDGLAVDVVTGTVGSPRGRRAGTQNRERQLSMANIAQVSASDLGISFSDAQDMFVKNVGPVGRQPNERTETELFVRDKVTETWNRYADADYPADEPGKRIGDFIILSEITWAERQSMRPLDAQTIKRLAAIPDKAQRKAALSQIQREYFTETFSPEIEDAKRDLSTALRDLRRPDDNGDVLPIGMHVLSPRQHASGAYLVPFTVYLRQSAEDGSESDSEGSES